MITLCHEYVYASALRQVYDGTLLTILVLSPDRPISGLCYEYVMNIARYYDNITISGLRFP